VLRTVGKGSCAVGALLLAFVAYQLWGTSLSEHSAQARLRSELSSELHRHRAATGSSTTSARGDTTPTTGDTADGATVGPATADAGAGDTQAIGSPIGFLTIPRIGMSDDVIVEGVGTDQLRQGPGHYPGTPLPGQPGNSAIAGHRTTYAAPFYNLNELQVGDPIIVQTLQGTFRYAVTDTLTVSPTDATVLDATSEPELTLTTCTPRYSATGRLVVHAELQSSRLGGLAATGTSTARPTTTKGTRTAATTLAGDGGDGSVGGAVLWGLLTVAFTLGLWVLWRRVRGPRRWGVLVLGTPIALVGLFVFFGHVSAVLPASF
jgi:sortase A